MSTSICWKKIETRNDYVGKEKAHCAYRDFGVSASHRMCRIHKEEGYDPFRTSTVRRFVKMPFGVTYIKTENSRYILRSPAKAAVKEVRA